MILATVDELLAADQAVNDYFLYKKEAVEEAVYDYLLLEVD